MISFIFYTCSERLDNLQQTIRFLEKRERNLKKEIIIVYQNEGPQLENTTTYNLKLDSYKRPIMCNFGVKKANYEIITLIDSDRILPKNYFASHAKNIKQNEMITTSFFHNLLEPTSDQDIENHNYKFTIEKRSKSNQLRMKNMLSGNTMFYKKDYQKLGGMDESFTGYGYADTDLTTKAIQQGIQFHFDNVPEIHLWHPKSVNYKGQILNDFQIQSATNMIKYAKKWKVSHELIDVVCKEVIQKINIYPQELIKEFTFQYKQLYLS